MKYLFYNDYLLKSLYNSQDKHIYFRWIISIITILKMSISFQLLYFFIGLCMYEEVKMNKRVDVGKRKV